MSHKRRQGNGVVYRPPASFIYELIYERPPFRAAAAARRNKHSADSFGGGAAVVGGSGAE